MGTAGKTLRLAAGFGIVFLLAGGAWAMDPGRVVKAGEEELLVIQTPHPAPRVPAGELAWFDTFEWPGASYIAVHFSRFDLAEGERVVVQTPSGSHSYTFTGKGKPETGGTFWATHVPGDVCRVLYYGNGDKSGFGYEVDRFAHGYPNLDQQFEAGIQTEAVCGTDQTGWAKCYQTSEPTIYTRGKAVARLLINGSGWCTGWLVGSEGHVMTNNHCIATQTDASNTDFDFMAEGSTCSTSCASGGACGGTVLSSSTLIKTDAPRDYALVKLASNPTGTYGYLQLRSAGAVVNERIYIPQHPAGYGKKIAVTSTDSSDQSGYCEVYSLSEAACQTGGPSDVGYFADTQGGSSGSPVLGYSDHLVVALHHCANCPNRGVPIQSVISHLGSSLPANATPGGGTTYSISGTITLSGAGLGGVTVTAGSGSATTTSAGAYTVSGLANGTYTVTPSKAGYTFTPTSQSVTISSANVTGKNFTATSTSTDTPLTSGVAVNGSVALQSYKYYYITVPSGASQLKVELYGLSADVDVYTKFNAKPTTAAYDGKSENGSTTSELITHASPAAGTWWIAAYGYAAGSYTVKATVTTGSTTYSISGQVTLSGSGFSGVTIACTGQTSKTTDASGNYTFTGLANGTYTITPSKTGYTFSPVNLSVTISGASQTGKNFAATAASGDTQLTSGVAVNGSVALQAYMYYYITVPSGATQLKVELYNLSADVDLYAKFNAKPTTSVNDGSSANGGTTAETITKASPSAGTWWIAAYGYAAGSYTVKATVTTGGGGGTTQILTNANFDSSGGWTNSGVDIGGARNSISPRSAPNMASFCYSTAYQHSTTDTVYQQVTIPSGATAATLNFYYFIKTAETTTTTAYDKLTVTVESTSGTTLATLNTLSNLNKNTAWTAKTGLNLLSYKGQTVRIRFKGTTDSTLGTSFMVDDVTLNVTQ